MRESFSRRRMSAGASGEAVDEGAFGVFEEAAFVVVDFFGGGVVGELVFGDEPGLAEGVVFVVGGFDFVEVGFGKEAAVGEEAFVHGAELVNAELGVGDAADAFGFAASATFAAAGPGEGEEADDLLPGLVAELDFVEEGGAGGVEEVGLEAADAEGVVEGGVECVEGGLGGVVGFEAFGDELEEGGEGLVEVGAVAGVFGGEGDVFEFAEGVEAVAGAVDAALHGEVAEGGAGLGIEEKEEAVEEAEAFLGEVFFEVALVDAKFLFAELVDDFVAEEFDGFAGGVFEVLGNGEGVFVGVFVEAVEQRAPLPRAEGVAVKEGGEGAEGGGFAAAEDFGEVEAEEAFFVPLGAVDEEEAAGGGEEDPAGRLGEGEEFAGDEVFGGERGGFGGQVVEVGGIEGELEGIGGVACGFGDEEDPEPGGSAGVAASAEEAEAAFAVGFDGGGFGGMAEGGEEFVQNVALGVGAFGGVGEAGPGVAGAEEVGGEGAEGLVGGSEGGVVALAVGPGGGDRLEVVVEQRLEVVGGVVFVTVEEAGHGKKCGVGSAEWE